MYPWISPITTIERIDRITNFLHIRNSSNLGTYLGYPLKAKYTNSDFNQILNRLQQKLQGWRQSLCSFAGRTHLTTTTTNTMPNYYMRVFNLPQKIKNQIDKINKNFLWGHIVTTKKMHIINWEIVTKPKYIGSLGIKSSSILNAALMAKLRWDLETQQHKLWAIFFKQKYKKTRTTNLLQKNTSFIFKSIFKDKNIFKNCITHIIKDREKTNHWKDS